MVLSTSQGAWSAPEWPHSRSPPSIASWIVAKAQATAACSSACPCTLVGEVAGGLSTKQVDFSTRTAASRLSPVALQS